MKFEPGVSLDGYQTWCCLKGDISLVVGFDVKYPERGFSASYKKRGEKTSLIGEGFATRTEAEQAAIAAVARLVH